MSELIELKEALRLLNCSPNASRFYLESYRLGPASIGQVALSCGMDRSSAYLAFDQLKELGLVAEDLAGARKKILAKSPKAVLAKLRTEIRRIRRQAETLETSMPSLLAAYSQETAKPVLQFFSGKEGLRRISDDILEHAHGEILLCSNFERESAVFSEEDHREFIRERIRRGIGIRVIATASAAAENELATDRAELRQTRIVERNAFEAETYIYGDSVAMLSHNGDIIGFIVRSDAFAASQRWMFEQIWKHCGANHERDARARDAGER